jgi:hypothetical protein
MGLRDRKHLLLTSLKMQCLVAKIPKAQIDHWEGILRKARSPAEQNQVMTALGAFLNGWKTGTDSWSILRRGGLLNDDDEET